MLGIPWFFIIVIVVALLLISISKNRRGGTNLDLRACKACGATHPLDAQFCRRCGNRL